MSHPREPIPQTCPQIDKIVGKIKYLNKQFPRHWSDVTDLEKLQELAEEMQSVLEDCDSEFELLRRSNEMLRGWGEQEAVDCDKLEEQIQCSPTERAFLDEIREKFAISNQTLLSRQPMVDGEYVILFQSDFKCNLQELVEKENNG